MEEVGVEVENHQEGSACRGTIAWGPRLKSVLHAYINVMQSQIQTKGCTITFD